MAKTSSKKAVQDFLNPDSREGLSGAVSYAIFILIIVNVGVVILESVPELYGPYRSFFFWFEVFSVAVFTTEYVLRVWSITSVKEYKKPVSGRLRFMATPMMIIDLLAVLPFYLPYVMPIDLSVIRLLRLFRILSLFKATRYSSHLQIMAQAIKNKKEELVISVMIVGIVLIFVSSIMYAVEQEAQPEAFSSIPQAMWWGIATLTTVGYGDVYPITPLGKLMASLIALLGIGIVALPAGILASGFNDSMEGKKAMKK